MARTTLVAVLLLSLVGLSFQDFVQRFTCDLKTSINVTTVISGVTGDTLTGLPSSGIPSSGIPSSGFPGGLKRGIPTTAPDVITEQFTLDYDAVVRKMRFSVDASNYAIYDYPVQFKYEVDQGKCACHILVKNDSASDPDPFTEFQDLSVPAEATSQGSESITVNGKTVAATKYTLDLGAIGSATTLMTWWTAKDTTTQNDYVTQFRLDLNIDQAPISISTVFIMQFYNHNFAVPATSKFVMPTGCDTSKCIQPTPPTPTGTCDSLPKGCKCVATSGLTFCSSVNYPVPVAINEVMVDGGVKVVYDGLSASGIITGQTCLGALKNMMCATAFPRCEQDLVLPVCSDMCIGCACGLVPEGYTCASVNTGCTRYGTAASQTCQNPQTSAAGSSSSSAAGSSSSSSASGSSSSSSSSGSSSSSSSSGSSSTSTGQNDTSSSSFVVPSIFLMLVSLFALRV